MNITSLDLLLLGAVPSVVAVLGAGLWRLAVHRVVRAANASAPSQRHRSPAAPVLVPAGGDSPAVTPHGEPVGR